MGTSSTTTTSAVPRPGPGRQGRGPLFLALLAAAALVLGLGLVPAAQAAVPASTAAAVPSSAGGATGGSGQDSLGHLLRPGQTLKPGQRLTSQDGRDALVMQGDGNLVLYGKGVARWSTRTVGNSGARLVFQWDHNLVLRSKTNKVLWTSATHRAPAGTVAFIRHGEFTLWNGQHVWSTRSGYDRLRTGTTLKPGQHLVEHPGSSESSQQRMVMQTDGNLVYYDEEGKVHWSTRTNGNPGARAVMQADGNLVVYSRANKPLWASGTRGAGLQFVISPYLRGFFCEDLDAVINWKGPYVVNPRDRPLVSYPMDQVSSFAEPVGSVRC
jgi:exopolysaccharide biosynthesis protein